MKYFSTFSGIGGFEIPLIERGFECVGFSEIDKYAIQVYQKHFPKHKNYGDISLINPNDLPDFDLLVGGSPCQDLSISKNARQGLKGLRSGLFYNFVEILKIKKPKYFILENVASMSNESKDEISKIMGVEPVMINAALVSAQNRKRLFWTNFPISQPKDKEIYLKDILEEGTIERPKSYAIDANYFKGGKIGVYPQSSTRNYTIRIGQIGKGGQGDRIYSIQGKSVNLSANGGGRGAKTGLYLENEVIRKLTPVECARLQCFPDNWCEGLSNTQQYKCYGNAVNVEVVRHIVAELMSHNGAKK